MHYTYIHFRASDKKPFYVGKGQRERAWRNTRRNAYWHNTVNKHGIEVMVCATWDTAEEALAHEKLLIAILKECGAPLCNMTDGGEGTSGYVMTPEHRANMIAAKTGKPLTPAQHAANERRRGKPLSAETRKKMSDAQKNKPRSAAQIASISALHAQSVGRPLAEETKQKLSVINTGKRHTEATKAKMSEAKKANPTNYWLGKKRSPRVQKEVPSV